MQPLSKLTITLLTAAVSVTAAPTEYKSEKFAFQLVNPIDHDFSIKVPSQLFIEFCQDANFGEPCSGGDVAPGLCYYAPFPGVSAVWPGEMISGCTLYRSYNCNATAGDLMDVAYPGVPNLTTEDFNDQVNSFICY